MRDLVLAFGLILWGAAAGALEVEEEVIFPGATDTVVSILSTTDAEAFAPVIAAFQAQNPEMGVR